MFHNNTDATVNLLSALARIGRASSVSQDLTVILTQIGHSICDLIGGDAAGVVLWDADKAQFCPEVLVTTSDGPTLVDWHNMQASQWIVEHGQPFVVQDTMRDPFAEQSAYWGSNIRSYVGVPLVGTEQPLGVLYAFSLRPRRFDQGELAMLQMVADVSATVVCNAKLVQSLQLMNDFKQTMLHLIAHDLRNPLAEAVGFLDLLVSEIGELDAEKQDYAEYIERALKRMETLIDGVLVHERATLGCLILRSCELTVLVGNVLGIYQMSADQKAQRLSFEPPEVPLYVQADDLLLGEAVGNLVSNAIKYAPENSVIIIRVEKQEDEAVVSIINTGSGISQEDQQKLFHPFVRLDSAGKKPGVGLGLSLVKMVTERHNGHVSVCSVPDHETCFSIHLPCWEQ